MSKEQLIELLEILPFKAEHRVKEDEVQVRCFQTFSTFLKANDWYKVLKTTSVGIVVEVVASDGVPYGLGFGKDHFGVRAEEDIVVGKSKTPKKKVVAAVVETVVEEPKSLFEVMEVSDSSLEEQEEEIFTESDIYAEDLLEDNVETFDSSVAEQEPSSFVQEDDKQFIAPEDYDLKVNVDSHEALTEEYLQDPLKREADGVDLVFDIPEVKLSGLEMLVLKNKRYLKEVDAFGNPKVFNFKRKLHTVSINLELKRAFLWYTLISEGIASFKELLIHEDVEFATQVGILVDSKNKVVGEYLTTIAEYPIIANIKMLELHDYLDLTNYSDLDFEIIQEFHSQYKILKALC